MNNIQVPTMNEILANLLLAWEKTAPHILYKILLTNEKMGDIINKSAECRQKLDLILKIEEEKTGLLQKLPY